MNEIVRSIFADLQRFLILRKGVCVGVFDREYWDSAPVVYRLPITGGSDVMLLRPMDTPVMPSVSELEGIKTGFTGKFCAIVVSSSEGMEDLAARIERETGKAVAVIDAGSRKIAGNKMLVKFLEPMFDPQVVQQYHEIDPQGVITNFQEQADARRQFAVQLQRATPRIIITPAIIALNVAMFIVMAAGGVSLFEPSINDLLKWGADFGPMTVSGEWWRIISSTFIHIGVIHILLNMWVLWDLGRLTERLFGNFSFTIVYIVSGIGGSVASLSFNPFLVSAGASGAIFGLGGALAGFMVFRKNVIPKSVLGPLAKSTLAFIAYNVVFGFAVKNVDNAAHIGGLVTGFVAGGVLSRSISPVASFPVWIRSGGILVIAAILAGGFFLAEEKVTKSPQFLKNGPKSEEARQRYNEFVGEAKQALSEIEAVERDFSTEMKPEDAARLEKMAAEALQKLSNISVNHPDVSRIKAVLVASVTHLRNGIQYHVRSDSKACADEFEKREAAWQEFSRERDAFMQKYGLKVEK